MKWADENIKEKNNKKYKNKAENYIMPLEKPIP